MFDCRAPVFVAVVFSQKKSPPPKKKQKKRKNKKPTQKANESIIKLYGRLY